MPSLLAKRPRSCERLALHGKEAAPQHKTSMVLVHVKYGEASMAPAVFNPDCDSATLLDYVRRRAVKDTEAYARQADARVSAFVGEVANDLARARASADRISRSLEGEGSHQVRRGEIEPSAQRVGIAPSAEIRDRTECGGRDRTGCGG